MVSPSNDVRSLYIVAQPDVGWGDNGLTAIVSLGRNREDRLPGKFRIAVLWFGSLRAAGIERRQILGRRVVDYIRGVEAASLHHVRAGRQQC